jgi:hypothetical protein
MTVADFSVAVLPSQVNDQKCRPSGSPPRDTLASLASFDSDQDIDAPHAKVGAQPASSVLPLPRLAESLFHITGFFLAFPMPLPSLLALHLPLLDVKVFYVTTCLLASWFHR